ncbi:p63 related protein [Ophiostoma piceae UAMH 11346]|uniref:p63 related protein n=1 Tax=Ophiostoma piceae (strain UAMH 11346) TaxID=1262450 RepID=S3C8I1_OPHP1|nr:p63 related protein [Ophiostoma piceae UAMH 11346]
MGHLGPLTTVWTAPSGCNDNHIERSRNYGWKAQICTTATDGYWAADDVDCWPPRSGPATSSTDLPLGAFGYYSPGLECPAGFTTACHQTGGGSGNFQFNFAPSASETAYGCCPSGYFCTNDGQQTCISIATSTTIPTVQCKQGGITSGYISLPYIFTIAHTSTTTSTVRDDVEERDVDTVSYSTTEYTSTYSYSAVTVRAPLIQLVVRDSDVTASSSSSTPSAAASTTSDTTSPETSSPAVSSGPTLTSGAIAGIAVGAVAGVAFLAAAVFCFFKARARKHAYTPGVGVENTKMNEVAVTGQQVYEAPSDTYGAYSPGYSQTTSSTPMYWQGYDTPHEPDRRHELQ